MKGVWYRQEGRSWVLYLNDEALAEFDTRGYLLAHCGNTNHRPQWRPHWAAPDGAKIVGQPRRSEPCSR